MKEKRFKILFTGGGTGGHTIPIIAVARELRGLLGDRVIFYYLGPEDDFVKMLFQHEDIKTFTIPAGKVRRYLTLESLFLNFLDILKAPLSFLLSIFFLLIIWPDLVFSKGGFGAFFPNLISWLFGIPIFLHESDAVAGLSNRICGKFAKKVFLSFENTEGFSPNKTILTGNPIRDEILEGNREEAKAYFQLSGEKPVILVLGGSQGARRINAVVLGIVNKLLENFEIIHQCGEKNFKETEVAAKVLIREDLKKFYHLFGFLKEKELAMAYSIADLILSRAGAGAIFEIAAMGKPSILIPLPESAQNHQLKNATIYTNKGAAILVEEKGLTPDFLLGTIQNLFANPHQLRKMGEAALEFAKPQAAREIAKYLVTFLDKR